MRVDLKGHLDEDSFRLLPLLYANLARIGCDDRLMGRLRGIYRHSWCETQLHLRRGAGAINLLHAEGIPVMISKGLVLAAVHYESPGLRPISDIDVLVPTECARASVDVLEAAGWRVEQHQRRWRTQPHDMMAVYHAIMLRHPQHGELDLHWHLLGECASREADAHFWGRAVPVAIGDVHAVRPASTDLLFQVVIHGMRPNLMAPLRWVADAAMVLRRDAATIGWEEMLAFADRMRLRHRLSIGLAYLHEAIGLDLPNAVISGARAAPSWIERIESSAQNANLLEVPHRRRTRLNYVALLARFLVGDNKRYLPRLAFRWIVRWLLPHRGTA
jgi:hypothetical protein